MNRLRLIDWLRKTDWLTVLVPRFSTRHLRTARSPGLTVMFLGVGRNTDRGGYTAPLLTAADDHLSSVDVLSSEPLTWICRDDETARSSTPVLAAAAAATSHHTEPPFFTAVVNQSYCELSINSCGGEGRVSAAPKVRRRVTYECWKWHFSDIHILQIKC